MPHQGLLNIPIKILCGRKLVAKFPTVKGWIRQSIKTGTQYGRFQQRYRETMASYKAEYFLDHKQLTKIIEQNSLLSIFKLLCLDVVPIKAYQCSV